MQDEIYNTGLAGGIGTCRALAEISWYEIYVYVIYVPVYM